MSGFGVAVLTGEGMCAPREGMRVYLRIAEPTDVAFSKSGEELSREAYRRLTAAIVPS